MSEARLPAHLEVSGMIRAVEAAGGFATVLAKGERDAGVILVLTIDRGENARLWERLPRLDGRHIFELARTQTPETTKEFEEYLQRRIARDSDVWLIELDIPNPERFIAELSR